MQAVAATSAAGEASRTKQHQQRQRQQRQVNKRAQQRRQCQRVFTFIWNVFRASLGGRQQIEQLLPNESETDDVLKASVECKRVLSASASAECEKERGSENECNHLLMGFLMAQLWSALHLQLQHLYANPAQCSHTQTPNSNQHLLSWRGQLQWEGGRRLTASPCCCCCCQLIAINAIQQEIMQKSAIWWTRLRQANAANQGWSFVVLFKFWFTCSSSFCSGKLKCYCKLFASIGKC